MSSIFIEQRLSGLRSRIIVRTVAPIIWTTSERIRRRRRKWIFFSLFPKPLFPSFNVNATKSTAIGQRTDWTAAVGILTANERR